MRYALVIFLHSLLSWGFSQKKPETKIYKKSYPSAFQLSLQRSENTLTAVGSSPLDHDNVHLIWHLPSGWKITQGQQSETLSLKADQTFSRSIAAQIPPEATETPFVEVYVETKRGRFGSTATTGNPIVENGLRPAHVSGSQLGIPEGTDSRVRIIQ